MQNSPDLLTRVLQNPTLLEAELGRRRARDGTDGDVLAWIEATFGVHIPAVACCEGHVAPELRVFWFASCGRLPRFPQNRGRQNEPDSQGAAHEPH